MTREPTPINKRLASKRPDDLDALEVRSLKKEESAASLIDAHAGSIRTDSSPIIPLTKDWE